MKVKYNRFFISAVLIIFLISGLTPACKKGGTESASGLSARFQSILEEYWEHKQASNPLQGIMEGKNVSELPDLSFEETQKEAAFSGLILEKLKAIDSSELEHKDWIDYEVLKWRLENEVAAPQYYWHTFIIPPVSGFITYINRAYTGYSFAGAEDLQGYIDLLKLYPDYIRTALELTREQMERGIVLPREMFPMVNPFLDHILVKDEQSPFFVKRDRLTEVDEGETVSFQAAIKEYINTEVFASLQEFADFIRGDYYSRTPDSVGLWQYPGGREYYSYLVKVNTTLDLTPEEIHRIGLEEVEKIEARVEKIKEELKFEGSLAEFRHFLKTDKRFFPNSPEEIEERLMSFVKLMAGRIPEYFSAVPKAPYGVKRLAPELEGSMTFGYYQMPTAQDNKGYYMYNGSKLEERSLLMAEALIYHELVPGHHFHIASQLENENIPEFRKYFLPNAFNEGWAEYSAWLGLEMGLFEDPYSLIGRHMLDMMLATRLVVDTGMNYLEWPRSKAAEFMRNHMIESETQIYTESLRYAVRTPAQALGYKLGSIKMMELRRKAEAELGDRFDIKKFHQAVLGNGALPLTILEKHIDWFIEQEEGNSN